MNPDASFSPYQALLWVGASPARIVAAIVVLIVVGLCAPTGAAVIGCALWRSACRVGEPWLRFAAWWYLTRDRDVEPVSSGREPSQHADAGLLPVAEDDAPWFDPEPGPVSVCEVLGADGFAWLDASPLPHRPTAAPCPAEVAEDIEQVLTLATRLTREAAQGGAQ